MSIAEIKNSILGGEIIVPPSKSVSHRAIFCSLLAGGEISVSPIIDSNDMKASLGVIEEIKKDKERYTIDCIESGSTLRFAIPIVAALGKSAVFIGSGRLPERPIGDFLELLPQHGVECVSDGGLPLKISGQLQSGEFEIAGNTSSQYITGLLLALPILDGDSKIVLTTELQSKPYVDMTIKVMDDFDVKIEETDYGYFVKGNQKYKKTDYSVESDWSQAAFFMEAAAIGANINLKGLKQDSTQGDKAVVDEMKKFGATVDLKDDVYCCKSGELVATEIDAKNIPDMVPALAVVAAFAKGKTVIKGAERLRIKESDRIESIVYNLKEMGADVTETPDGMVICGGAKLHSADFKGFNDHRIVMAFTVAALNLDGESTIDDAESINKSYPDFFKDIKKLGGKVDVLNIR